MMRKLTKIQMIKKAKQFVKDGEMENALAIVKLIWPEAKIWLKPSPYRFVKERTLHGVRTTYKR